ncbi:MAG: MFS transporter [Actinobacteria bacterium]|nr:MFS transporter [Actinomycetota bacterium]
MDIATTTPGTTTATEPTPLRYALALGLVGFVTSFGAHVVAVNLPLYASQVGVGVAVIGLLIAVYDLAEVFAKPLFGWLADREGMKRTMLAGIVVFVAASLLYLVVPPQLLFAVRFLQGVGAAALSAVSLALVAVYYREQRGRAYGAYNTVKGAGYVLSPLVGGLIVAGASFAAIFLAAAAVGAVALGVALWLPREPPRERSRVAVDDNDDLSLAGLRDVLADRELRRWFAVIVVNMFFVGIIFGFLPVRIAALGYDPTAAGVLLALVALGYLLVQPLAGRAADCLGAAPTIRFGLGLAALATIALALLGGGAFLAASLLAGVGVGIVWTNTDALVSELAEPDRLGATMGTAGSVKELGDMVGPITIGLLAQGLGVSVGLALCGGLGLLALLLLSRRPLLGYPKSRAAPVAPPLN